MSMRRRVERANAPVSSSVPRYSRTHENSRDMAGHHRLGVDGSHVEEEGVEVVLGPESTKVIDSPPRGAGALDQNVFRAPSSHAVRPRAIRAHGSSHGSSMGYGPPRGEYMQHPMAVPYNPSGSFDEGYHHPQQQQHHYSPHVQYPQPGRYPSEDVNVISPSHGKADSSPYDRPPRTPQPRHGAPPGYYQYPPTSPVSRPGGPHSHSPSSKPPYGSSRRVEGPYSAAQREHSMSYHPEDGTWNPYPPPLSSEQRPQPPLVTESSFDSDHYPSSQYSPHPPTPGAHPPTPAVHPPTPRSHNTYDPHQQFYGGGGSWGSFDAALNPPPAEDHRYYGYHPESPYSPYSPDASYYGEPYPPPYHPYDRPPHTYEDEGQGLMRDYHRDGDEGHNAVAVTPNDHRKGMSSPQGFGTPVASNTSTSSGMLLPKAAYEVDFVVTNPPTEPVLPPSTYPLCKSPAEINKDDVLCGRGGGTNSQIGNRRFRKLVQEFQPTYLLARRKEKPLLARTIVLIIRKRGGRFLKKDEDTGELFEVGDSKAEAKTSQALREGLDVRATKGAASSLLDKKPKKKGGKEGDNAEDDEQQDDDQTESPSRTESSEANESPAADKRRSSRDKTPSPPPDLPRLHGDAAINSGIVHPHSPEALQFRKRRRMRSGGCIPFQDKLFPEFCPPRADLARAASPEGDEEAMNMATPPRRNASRDMGDRYTENVPQPGCADIAMMMMTGAAKGSFCLGPKWRASN